MTCGYVSESFIVGWLTTDTPRYGRNAEGYGLKIPTHRMVRCKDGKTRRVYAVCIANAASHFIVVGGQDRFVPDWAFPA